MYGPFSVQGVPLPFGASGIPKEQLHVSVICELHKVALFVLVVQGDVVVHHGLPMHRVEGEEGRGTYTEREVASGHPPVVELQYM